MQRQLHTVTRTIEETGTRTRVMERRLRAVEQMDPVESATILALPAAGPVDSAAEDENETAGEIPGAA